MALAAATKSRPGKDFETYSNGLTCAFSHFFASFPSLRSKRFDDGYERCCLCPEMSTITMLSWLSWDNCHAGWVRRIHNREWSKGWRVRLGA